MSSHSFHPPRGSLEIDVVTLFAKVTVGGTGAATLTSGKGVTSVTRNSAGKYTFLLDDAYNAFLYGNAKILHSTLSDPQTVGITANLFSEAVATVAAPTVVFQFQNVATGAAADPASGAVFYVVLHLRNSSVT